MSALRLPSLLLSAALLAASSPRLLAQPVVTAAQDDATAAATRVPVGSTINYTTVISNTGAATANGVTLTNPTPANTTDVGSFNVTPVAVNDTYPTTVIPNTGIDTGVSSNFSVVTNDLPGYVAGAAVAATALTITAFDSVTTGGGAVSMVTSGANVGKFTYAPAPGFTGTDTFTYTINNTVGGGAANSISATVSITVSGPVIWYVNPAAGTNGNGTLASPFNNLASAVTAIGSNFLQRVFIYSGGPAQTTGITLNNGGIIVGQAAAGASFDAVMGVTYPADSPARPVLNAAGAKPVLSRSNGNTVTLSPTCAIYGVAISNSGGGFAVVGTGAAVATIGNTSTSDVTITASGTSSGAVSLTGAANGNVFISAPITCSSGKSVTVSNRTGSTVAFTQAITDTDAGISLTSNTGATIIFSGGLNLTTGANTAFNATGGGTVTATQNNTSIVNTITTTTGTALNVNATTIAAAGLNFRSISAGTASGSAGNGINLDTTGSLGGLTVTGNGVAGSGGTIQHKTGADGSLTGGIGIYLNNTQNASFSWMQLNDFDNNAIRGLSVTNFTLTNSVISGTSGTTSANADGAISFGTSNPSGANGLFGTSLIDNVNVSGAIEHTIEVYNQSGTFTLTISNCNIHDNSLASGGDGIQCEMQGTAVATININSNQFSNNKSQAIQLAANDSSFLTSTINGNTVTRGTQGNEGIVQSNGSNGRLTTTVSNNNISGFGGVAIFVGQTAGNANALSGGATGLRATISGNTIDAPTSATNHAIIGFLTSTVGQTSLARLLISNNTVTQRSTNGVARGILVDTPDTGTSPEFHATVIKNSVAILDNVAGVGGIVVQARQSSFGHFRVGKETAGDTDGNTVTYPNGNPGVNGIRVRQATGGSPAAVARLEQGSSSGAATTVLAANNPASSTEILGTVTVVGNNDVLLPADPLLLGDGGPDGSARPELAAPVPTAPALFAASPAEPVPPAFVEPPAPATPLTQKRLEAIVAAALVRWEAAGLSFAQRAFLRELTFEVSESLPGRHLGQTENGRIRISRSAAGGEWFIDPAPLSDDAFPHRPVNTRLLAAPTGSPAGKVDLLTTVLHEMGHALGLPDLHDFAQRSDLMFGHLPRGERRLPARHQAEGALAGTLDGVRPLAGSINLGALPPGKSVTVYYSVTVGPVVGNSQSVSSQAVISGSNFSSVNAVDAVAGSGPTVTLLAIPPTFTSANATTFTVGSLGNFSVTANAAPAAAFSFTGTLPAGVTLSSAGVLSGTPGAGTGGTYPITITANNGVAPNATQSFTLTVNQPPAVTSGNAAIFTVGTLGSFSVTTTGFPVPSLTRGGVALPSGVTFTDNGNGTGTLSGTPATGTGGTYALTFTAANGVGSNAVQNFTLTVRQAPAITSANNATFTVGSAGSFTVTTSGFPAPSLARGGVALPSGVTFTDNGDGTGTLAGTPGAGTGGTYALTFTATNVVNSTPAQSFTLTVNQAPAVTSANNVVFTVGTSGSFSVTTSGFPAPSLSLGGVTLPSGVTFTDNGNGTGTLGGTPGAGTGGTYALTFTAANGVGSSAVQNFTLTVRQAPAITSANAVTFTIGQAGSFTVTSTGFPTPSLARGGVALPSGVTFTDNGDGTGTLAGTPATGTAGGYALTFTASNVAGSSPSQSFTLTVDAGTTAPTISSANSTLFNVGSPGTFTVTSTGMPTATLAALGALPTGVTFTDNGDGTATLGGTPAAGSNGSYGLTITASNGTAPNATQSFTLFVNRPPVPTNDVLGAKRNLTARVAKAKLMHNDQDPDGDPLTLLSAGPTSAQGGLVSLVGTNVEYTPPTDYVGADSFSYTVSDGRGGQASGTVSVTVSDANQPSLNIVSITVDGSGALIVCQGLPGQSYKLQSTDNLSVPFADLSGPLTADGNGRFQYQDGRLPGQLPPSRYYRAVVVP